MIVAKKLQEKWIEIESLTVEDKIPDQAEIEKMVGLVSTGVKGQTLKEIIKSKTKEDYIREEA